MAGLFQVLWGKGSGEYNKAEALDGTDGEPLIIPIKNDDEQVKNICTRPWAVDWDADGDLDLLVGNFEGSFYVFKGEGEGKFGPKPEVVKTTDGTDLRINGAHSDPITVDWDEDGDLDVLSGSSQGGAQWAENTAGPGKVPALKPFSQIVSGKGYQGRAELITEGDLDGPTHSSRVWVTDYNGDGKLDLLLGDSVTLTSPADGMSEDDFRRALDAWEKEWAEVGQFPADASRDELMKRRERMNEMYEERDNFISEERTGYVWLFLRK